MVNMYGAGKAFNLRYAQNSYMPRMQTRMPVRPQGGGMFGAGPCCHHGPTNVTINNGPTGFWGFMSGLFGGLFGGGMMGGLFGGLFGGGSPLGALNSAATTTTTTAGGNDKLANLKTLYPNHNIVSDGNDKYSATDKDGNLVGQGLSYEDMCKALAKAKEPQGGKVGGGDDGKVGGDDGKGKVGGDDGKGKVGGDDGKAGGGDGGKVGGDDGGGKVGGGGNGGGGGGSRVGGSRSPQGWYRAANDNVKNIQASKGKNASEITSAILQTKDKGVLTADAQKELRDIIIKNNPSVFDQSTGEPLPNADYSKLDVPSMAWINEHFGLEQGETYHKQDDIYSGEIKHKAANGDYVKKESDGRYTYWDKEGNAMSEKDFKAQHPAINTTNIKNGGYSSQKGTRVTGNAGRYAEKNGNSWNYYAADGTQLKEEYIKKVDPQLYTKTQPTTNNQQPTTKAPNPDKTHIGGRQPYL